MLSFQQSGILLTLLMMGLFMLVSSLSSTLLSQSIALIPGNCHYERRFEFSSAILYYWGHRLHLLTSVLLNVTIQSYNLASIVICAQSIDQALVELTGRTFALTLYPHAAFTSLEQGAFDELTSGSFSLSLTLGYVLIVVLFLPTCFQQLDDNVKTVQLLSFLCFLVIMAEFTAFFLYQGAKPAKDGGGYHPIPLLGNTYTQLVSIFIFSWSYTMFVPSWLNEKRDRVSVNGVIWSAAGVALLGYVAFGLLCASVEAGIVLDNVLPMLSQSSSLITRIFAHLFALTIIAPGIPICSVSTRQNLLASGVFSRRMCYFLSAVLPFLLSFVFSSGSFFAQLLVWSSLLFNGVVNFLIPHALYLTALRRWQRRRRRRRRHLREQREGHGINGANGVVHHSAQLDGGKVEEEAEAEEEEAEEAEEAEVEKEESKRGDEADPSILEEAEDPNDPDEEEEAQPATPSPHFSSSSPLSLSSTAPSLALSASLLSVGSLPSPHSFHLPSSRSRHHPVYPFGRRRWLNSRAVLLTRLSMLGTTLLIVGQIACDLWYLLVKGENLLS